MKSRVQISKRLDESKKRLENLQIKSQKDKYYKLSYEITNKTLEEILNENISEDELNRKLDKLKEKNITLQKEEKIIELLKNNITMRVYNWVLNEKNNVEIEWVPLKYK
ncbi:hypothetical protein [uncultured Methanobrevibacter sp.]|uniref:hypothetical protein n=1 Tax=uncultured Methanobrevibacter sp. TaxID=253161 RepID=UPI0025E9EA84|nr:hypothetical protein [uncultured Methanobrevibacter sp.]